MSVENSDALIYLLSGKMLWKSSAKLWKTLCKTNVQNYFLKAQAVLV